MPTSTSDGYADTAAMAKYWKKLLPYAIQAASGIEMIAVVRIATPGVWCRSLTELNLRGRSPSNDQIMIARCTIAAWVKQAGMNQPRNARLRTATSSVFDATRPAKYT